MRSFALMGILFFGLLLFDPSILSAYENEAVTNGGTILGVVKFKGTPPPVKKLQITKDEEVCGKTVKTDPSLIVSQEVSVMRWSISLTSRRERKWMQRK